MFDPLFDFVADVLSWMYDLWPSYGGAIVLLTLVIMTVMAPVTVRQTKSMLAMQQLQPEVKRLREKYGKDRDAMNQEMMALYQANGVNPLGGCLPILIQMPIFLVLFQIIRGLTRRTSDLGLAVGEGALRDGTGITEFPQRHFNPDYLSTSSNFYQDLSVTTEMKSFGLDLSQSASSALGESVVTGLPYLLLVIGVGVTTWLQQKQIQGRSKNASINPQQQALMKILPFMLPVFSFGFPAALVVYWFVSNLFRVGQQVFITKRVYGGEDDTEIVRPEPPAKGKGKGNSNAAVETRTQRAEPRSGGVNHGSRRPVTNPPKKRKKPPSASSNGRTASPSGRKQTPKGDTPDTSSTRRGRRGKKKTEPEAPKPKPTSKRVTPKKSQNDGGSEPRGRKRKR